MDKYTYEELIRNSVYSLNRVNKTKMKPTRSNLHELITISKYMPQQTCIDIDKILLHELKHKKIFFLNELIPTKQIHKAEIYSWNGDITLLGIECIVNASNEQVLGCFIPGNKCVDNVIHTNSGPQLRNFCRDVMKNNLLGTGKVMISPAFCLPSKYIIHTVGPIIKNNNVSEIDIENLGNCYINSLNLCRLNKIKQIAFPNISTGSYDFPGDKAVHVAVISVLFWINNNPDYQISIVFCNYTKENHRRYIKMMI
jgi:O-acetyl-ADP-ribose deacetylase (regulator of RNase III)